VSNDITQKRFIIYDNQEATHLSRDFDLSVSGYMRLFLIFSLKYVERLLIKCAKHAKLVMQEQKRTSLMGYSLAKIAEELGVSKTTVSFVLNGKAKEHRISKKMQENIRNFCSKVNYSVNIHAQRMNRKNVGTIGVMLYPGGLRKMINPLSSENSANILGGVMEEAARQNCRVLIEIVTPETTAEKICEWFRKREIDGMIYYGMIMLDEWRDALIAEGCHVVGIGEDPGKGLPSVNIDNYASSVALTELLIKKGHRKMTFLNGRETSYINSERLRGFVDALKRHDIDYMDSPVNYAMFQESKAYAWAEGKIKSGSFDEDAIVCANDKMAIGVINALKDNGIKVPDDVAITGADGISLASYITPSLTTYSMRPTDLGIKAYKLLFRIINGEKTEKNIKLKSEIIIRESI
jgi:DNA-binding LacI/PurR family transcriptional regulator